MCHKRTSTAARPNLTNVVIAKTQIHLVVRIRGKAISRISSLLSSERRKLRNHSVRAVTGPEWLRAEDSRL